MGVEVSSSLSVVKAIVHFSSKQNGTPCINRLEGGFDIVEKSFDELPIKTCMA